MIPIMAFLRIRTRRNRGFRLWIPLFLVWLVLLPLVLVILPFAFLACLIGQVNPFRALSVSWQLLAGLRNANVEIAQGQVLVLVHVI
jgi:hypothetical protein